MAPAAAAAKARSSRTATKKATPARKRSSSAKPKSDGTTLDRPKLSKKEKDAVAEASRLGLDVDPLNFDIGALESAIKVATKFLAMDESTAVEVVGPDGVAFTNGHLMKSTASTLRLRGQHGTEEIPVELIGDVREIQGEVKPIGAETARAKNAGPVRRSSTSSEPRPPREGSGLWAALEVLKKARTPMTGADVFAKIKERKLAPGLKGKTPEATITAALNVAAARGHHGVVRPEPGRFAIQKGGK